MSFRSSSVRHFNILGRKGTFFYPAEICIEEITIDRALLSERRSPLEPLTGSDPPLFFISFEEALLSRQGAPLFTDRKSVDPARRTSSHLQERVIRKQEQL